MRFVVPAEGIRQGRRRELVRRRSLIGYLNSAQQVVPEWLLQPGVRLAMFEAKDPKRFVDKNKHEELHLEGDGQDEEDGAE